MQITEAQLTRYRGDEYLLRYFSRVEMETAAYKLPLVFKKTFGVLWSAAHTASVIFYALAHHPHIMLATE